MSHTVGQITEDNQNSKASQGSSPIEDKTDSDVSLLSDADYEFLFNQLLEGVAHGWHDRRIVKFFDQLGDRGKPENWVVWLERLRSKIITLPLQSKRQLGTIMIRLGELTQSTSEVSKIGAVSNRIGRELLFGNTEDVVWEYVGPDLILDSPIIELETEENFSERLPEDFAELGKTVNEDKVTTDTSSTRSKVEKESAETSPSSETPIDLSLESTVEEDLPQIDLDSLEELPQQIPLDRPVMDSSPEMIVEEESSLSIADELAISLESDDDTSEAHGDISQKTKDATTSSTFSDEFEFELDSQESEPVTEDLIPNVLQQSSLEQQEELLSIVESANSLSSAINSEEDLPTSQKPTDLDSESADMEQIMNLIQKDEKLAQEISQKLNISPVDLNKSVESPKNYNLANAANLDSSTIDLIEGWFNLGLKQVSGGEFDKAISSWEKALNINPNLSEAWHNRGSALGRLGKYREAVESFQKALAINPHNYQAWSDRAHALYQLRDWAAAADSWSNAIKIAPANHLFWYNRGCALEQLESWAESISSYEKSLEIKPDFQPARSRYTNLIADNSRSN